VACWWRSAISKRCYSSEPQFSDASRDFTLQVLIMGGTAMAVAAISDAVYMLLASRLFRAGASGW
jgi:hypothetical protein